MLLPQTPFFIIQNLIDSTHSISHFYLQWVNRVKRCRCAYERGKEFLMHVMDMSQNEIDTFFVYICYFTSFCISLPIAHRIYNFDLSFFCLFLPKIMFDIMQKRKFFVVYFENQFEIICWKILVSNWMIYRWKYWMIFISSNFWYSLRYTKGSLLVWWVYHWYVWHKMNMNWKYSRRIWNEIYLFNIVFVVQFKSSLSAEDMIAIINWYIGVHQRYKMKCCLHVRMGKGCNYNHHHLLLWTCFQ